MVGSNLLFYLFTRPMLRLVVFLVKSVSGRNKSATQMKSPLANKKMDLISSE